jgi:predicted transcriptional regulator
VVRRDDAVAQAAAIVAAYVSNNQVSQADLPVLLKSLVRAISIVEQPGSPAPTAARDHGEKPAVPIRKSISDEYLICLEDGARVKLLKPYLMRQFNMTPAEYRAKWHLPVDYPMVAPNQHAMRSQVARTSGLGRNGTVVRRGRRPKSASRVETDG